VTGHLGLTHTRPGEHLGLLGSALWKHQYRPLCLRPPDEIVSRNGDADGIVPRQSGNLRNGNVYIGMT